MQAVVNTELTSRELIRNLRATVKVDGCLPESVAWQTFVELRRRDEPDANTLFIGTLRSLHSRRCMAGMDLPMLDHLTDEHRLVEDPFLGDLWKAYKKCIKNNRTGPAQQLLRDIEERINEVN